MNLSNVLAVVLVPDLDAAVAWYARLFGRPADRRPMATTAEWQLTESGGLQVVQGEPGGGFVTLGVRDLDEQVSTLAARGLATSEITGGETPNGETPRIARIDDPAGNTIVFGEEPGARPNAAR